MVTASPNNTAYALSALASMILNLSERGVCTRADTEHDVETHVYALPHSSLTVVSLLHPDGGLTFVVQDGGVVLFRLCGDSEADMRLEANGSVTVYATAQTEVNDLTADHMEHLHRAIAQGV